MTQWRNIPGFPNYMISNEGEVLNKARDRLLSPSYTRDGHASVNLYLGGVRYNRAIDRMVLTAFLMPAPIQENVSYIPHHIDGDLSNCNIKNLEWWPRVRAYAERRKRRP